MEKSKYYIDIAHTYKGHCGYLYIFPVRNIDTNPRKWTFDRNEEKIIGFDVWEIGGYLLTTLNRYFDPSLQFFEGLCYQEYDQFDCYWYNFYSKDAVSMIITDLEDYISDQNLYQKLYDRMRKSYERKSSIEGTPLVDVKTVVKEEIDFYRRLTIKLADILSGAEEYEYILFMGP